jgi:hypothetical protein
MYVGYNKPYKKPVSLRGEVDLLLHFPFGGLIGGELLPHSHIPKSARNIFVKAKRPTQKSNMKYHW